MFRRHKTREDKFNAYLIGEGILSSSPKVDHNFYQLAGLCAGARWRVSAGYGQMPRDSSTTQDAANEDENVVIGIETDGDDDNMKPLSVDAPQNLFR